MPRILRLADILKKAKANGLTGDVLLKITLAYMDDNLFKYAKTSRDYQNWLFNNDGSSINSFLQGELVYTFKY